MNQDLSNAEVELQLDPDVTQEVLQVKTSRRITGGTEASAEAGIDDPFEVDLGVGLAN
jgi:hypothetical protein